VEALASVIKCPFCTGETLAESPSSVAGDYREIIAQRVAAGATDEEVIEEFAASFGDSYIIDGSRSGWTVVLWAIPVAVFIGGLVAIVGLRRASRIDTEVGS
jgi:cytochrome c-type biogenesis protein CcmH